MSHCTVEPSPSHIRCRLLAWNSALVDVFKYFLFFPPGEGKGRGDREGGRSVFYRKSQRGGVFPQDRGGGKGAGGCLQKIWGGGGAKYFFSGPRCPPSLTFGPNSGKKKAHKHKLYCPVGPSFHRMCPRDKPSLSLGQML